jgi:hypothetical protein
VTAPELTAGQAEALRRLRAHLDSGATAFSLQGGAGVGKTYLVGRFIRQVLRAGQRVCVAAPTHKACRVLRAKLDAAGVKWEFKPRNEVPYGVAVVDTTAALLGVHPVVDDDQGDELHFKASSADSLVKLFSSGDDGFAAGAPVLVVDECSMLGRDDLLQLAVALRARGAKLVCVGDEGQLPPVKKQAIDFAADFDGGSFTLDEVVRQARGSSIVQLAWAVRSDGADVERELQSAGLVDGDVQVLGASLLRAYLDALVAPDEDEGRRAVFIAYRNAVVDTVQEQCCERLYGHSAGEFRAGELVLAQTPCFAKVAGTSYVGRDGVTRPSKFPKNEQLCAVADQLRVVEFSDGPFTDVVYGVPVTLDRVDLPEGAANRRFRSYYLSASQLADPAHPFCVRKQELAKAARDLQARVKELREAGQSWEATDQARRDAWGKFFDHQGKVCSFSHPFAITSHKSQGSTYREAYVHVADLLRYNRRALYVAVTRPSERLYL